MLVLFLPHGEIGSQSQQQLSAHCFVPVHVSCNHAIRQAVNFYNLLANHAFDLAANQSFHKSLNQPINLAFNQSARHSVRQFIRSPVNQPVKPGSQTRQLNQAVKPGSQTRQSNQAVKPGSQTRQSKPAGCRSVNQAGNLSQASSQPCSQTGRKPQLSMQSIRRLNSKSFRQSIKQPTAVKHAVN
jgi:hypothetical protein